MEKLTPEVRAFLLHGARTGKLATVRVDGRPHVVPIWFVLDGDTLVFTTWHTTVKAKNIYANPRVSLCVDDETLPYAYVMVEGMVTLSDDLTELKTWATRIAARYVGAEQAAAFGQRNGVPGELLARLTPTKVLFEQNVAG
jgi:PPOX class probable F420-dependent enzyme